MDSTAAKKTSKRRTPATKRAPLPALSGEALATYLLALTAAATSAVTVAEACTRAKKAGHAVVATEVERALEQLARAGRLYRHPSAARTAKAAHSYWHESPGEFVRRRLQEVLGKSTQLTLIKLRACAPRHYRELIDAAIATLVRNRELFEKPGKAKTYTTTPVPATALLTAAQRKTLQGMLTKINAVRSPALTLAQLLQFLDGTTPLVASPAAVPTLTLLETLYRLDLPTRGGLSSMPIPFTWRRYAEQSTQPDRAAFEQLLLESAAAGRVELIAHEWPATLAPDDLQAAIRQPGGRVLYYWRPLEQQ